MIYFKMQNYEMHKFSNVHGQKERVYVFDIIRGWFASKERIVSDRTQFGELMDLTTGAYYDGDYIPVIFKLYTCHIRYISPFNSWCDSSRYSAKMPKCEV
jgi:hypothetical protein